MISVEVESLKTVGMISEICNKTDKDVLRLALKSSSSLILKDDSKTVRVKALPTYENTLIVSGNNMPKTEKVGELYFLFYFFFSFLFFYLHLFER